MKPLSDDLRLRIFEACQSGEAYVDVAERFCVSEVSVRRLMRRFRQTGSLAPLPGGRGPAPLLAGHEDQLRQSVAEVPDATVAEHTNRLNLGVSTSTVARLMARLGLTRKKKSKRAAEQDRPDVKAAREVWPEVVADIKAEDLAFVDETGANTSMARMYGYAPRGERVDGAVPLHHEGNITFLSALTIDGLVAPWARDHAVNGAFFVAWLEQILLPRLRPGMTVVMDNLPAHKVAGVREEIERAGCKLLYLPPYSPDLNPIENYFSKFKRLLRDAAARTAEAVCEAMRRAVEMFTPQEYLRYFRHCGYLAGQLS